MVCIIFKYGRRNHQNTVEFFFVRKPFGLMPKDTVELQQLAALMVLYVTEREIHSGSSLRNKKKIVE